jgi:hypothetical protein
MTQLKVNGKVKPVGTTKDGLAYGYVKSISQHQAERGFWKGKSVVNVYWPQLKSYGEWPADELAKA